MDRRGDDRQAEGVSGDFTAGIAPLRHCGRAVALGVAIVVSRELRRR